MPHIAIDPRTLSTAERWRLRRELEAIDGPKPPEWMTTAEVAAYLRLSPEALHIAYCRRKSWLPPRSLIGKQYRYRRQDVEACLRPSKL